MYLRVRLSPGEHDVLSLLAHGKPAKEVAAERGVTIQTIKNQLTSIYRKVDASSLVEAYYKLGWLVPDRPEDQAVQDLIDVEDSIDRAEQRLVLIRQRIARIRENPGGAYSDSAGPTLSEDRQAWTAVPIEALPQRRS